MQRPVVDSFRYRSLFWPVFLIGVGLVWFLANAGVIAPTNLFALIRLWPLILVVIGLDILFGRRSPLIGALIGFGAVGLVILFLILSPSLGLAPSFEVKTAHYVTPLENTTSASLDLNLSSYITEVKGLDSPDKLIEANLDYLGRMDYSVSGSAQKTISIGESREWFEGWWMNLGKEMQWNLSLSPQVPFDVKVDGGSGASHFDLSGLKLTRFDLNMGSGSMTIDLPASSTSYNSSIEGGSGSVELTLPKDTDLSLDLDGGSGSIKVEVPGNSGLRITVQDNGSGSVNTPARVSRISGDPEEDEGVFESSGYNQAAHKIQIVVSGMGSGSINLQDN